ncbi:uncharacterized protein LOC143840824 [Paroedura picta]|uniref:uncharacterized protein LOC143840824 n=1 Tax=Paroedura picta TaxID=143630 RepID=UPI004056F6A0
MEKKMLWVFTIVLIVGLSNALLPEGVCNVPARSRENCGYPGIGEVECGQKNCCFDSNVMGVPWCFKPDFSDADLLCRPHNFKTKDKVAMEHTRFLLCAVVLVLGLSSLANGNAVLSSQQCAIEPSARVDCGYPKISAEECNKKACCFDSSVPGVIWCFYPNNDPGYTTLFFIEIHAFQELVTTMEQKGIWLLSLVLVSGFSALVEGKTPPPECRCQMNPKTRVNCGYPGITPQQCRNVGCCFSSGVAGVPWCFSPSPPTYKKVCPTEVKVRKNCGYPGISAKACKARGCCFESHPPAVPWCFFHVREVQEC